MSADDIPALRILPMSDKIEGFRGLSIEEVQQKIFLRALPAMKGRFHYRASGLNAPPGAIVLFQFKARIVASAVFVRDERLAKPAGGYRGVLHFEPQSFRTFTPLDADAVREVWPWFKTFGHAKQHLNPAGYPELERRLQEVEGPKRAASRRRKANGSPTRKRGRGGE